MNITVTNGTGSWDSEDEMAANVSEDETKYYAGIKRMERDVGSSERPGKRLRLYSAKKRKVKTKKKKKENE